MMTPNDNWLQIICAEARAVSREVLEQTVTLAVELAREGREGRKVGTIFTVGDAEAVLRQSRPLILDPLEGHPEAAKRIGDADMRETAKELAQLDGAFVISDARVVVSAARYLNADTAGMEVPLGLGSRHMAAASISRSTRAVAVVVSESAVVRLFLDGELITEIIPELWMMHRYQSRIENAVSIGDEEVAVLKKAE